MEILISVFVGLLIMEGYAWLNDFAKWLLERAVRQISEDDQDRCREEWNADLDAMPNTMVKLVYALLNFRSGAAARINADRLEAKREEADSVFEELSAIHRDSVATIRKLNFKRATRSRKLETSVRHVLTTIDAMECDSSDQKTVTAIQNYRSAFEDFGDILLVATNRASDLLSVSIESVSAKLDHVDSLLKMVSAKRDEITQLSGKNSSSHVLAALLESITDDLSIIRNTLEDQTLDENPSYREWNRIMTAIKSAVRDFTPSTDDSSASNSTPLLPPPARSPYP